MQQKPFLLIHPQPQKYSPSTSSTQLQLISTLISQKSCPKTAHYEDIEYLVDSEQYMKRFYNRDEWRSKMFMFKEYYFYHQDCPRVFLHDVEVLYAKWQDRRRNFLYKKLRHLFNQPHENDSLTQSQEEVNGLTHFLFELSEYNPFSKKYYLRTQIKKEKESSKKGKNMLQTKDQISFLKHDLSNMLKQMTDLSIISTLDSTRITKPKIYHRKSQTQTQTHCESGSCEQSNSHSKSGIKISFKKKLQPSLPLPLKCQKSKYYQLPSTHPQKPIDIKQPQPIVNQRFNSPKLHPVENRQNSQERLKANSIFVFTSLGQFGQENNKVRVNSKREGYKLNLVEKVEKGKKLMTEKQEEVKKGINFIEGTDKKRTLTIRCASIGKLKSNNLEGIEGRHHQISLTKLRTKQDEICDKKLAGVHKNAANKLPSYKSEHLSSKKPFVKLKCQPMSNLNNKKKLQIKP